MEKIKYIKANLSLFEYCNQNSEFQYLFEEYDNTKNGLSPNEVFCSKKEKVWWVCQKCNHQWLSTVSNRIAPHGCPSCRACPQTSFTEKTVYYYMKKNFPDAVPTYKPKWLKGQELDVFIPSIQIAIEYDGQHWHQNTERDLKKDLLCEENGVLLIRLREQGCPSYDSGSIKFITESPKSDYSHLIPCLNFIFKYINCSNCDFDIDRDYADIKELFNRTIKEKSLAYLYPTIADQWHPTKNKSRTPMLVSAGSNQKAWWLGNCGHEWETRISHRTNGSNCPYCSNQRVLVGYNDLQTISPVIASEWHKLKNGSLTPQNVVIGSYKEYWWQCEEGHEWKASIKSRINSQKIFGCPFCSGHRVWSGFNDIGTTHSHLLSEWDYKNNDKQPSEVSKGSYYNAWWIGKDCKHNYQMKVHLKVSGCGCPYCNGKRILIGYNDLATLKPEWLTMFDYNKNEFAPENVVAGTAKPIWWICENGHSFERNGNRMLKSIKCPFCH